MKVIAGLAVAFASAVFACSAFADADAEREFADAVASGRPLDAEAAFRRLSTLLRYATSRRRR